MKWLKKEIEQIKHLHPNIEIASHTAALAMKFSSNSQTTFDVFTMERRYPGGYMIRLRKAHYHNRPAVVDIFVENFEEIYKIAQEYILEYKL